MALAKTALQRYSTNLLAGGVKIHWFTYATNDTLAEVTTDGYFNGVRDTLSANSIVDAVVDCDGTPNHVTLRLTAVPASGNVTCAIDTPAA